MRQWKHKLSEKEREKRGITIDLICIVFACSELGNYDKYIVNYYVGSRLIAC